ncbi:hypothetical protein [Rhodanobacter sp. OK091]|uniref:hypothetical protein n=1 Tax=Rhodanobacter sp. OK091 TaxID=1881037 RepID=UPI00091FBB53|nr:hypothetical protein [Rhodanobacter sp. OK091]SHM50061.1 hypothetical protein SAMN05428972_3822 [Rhodanobacter sp. OK091]
MKRIVAIACTLFPLAVVGQATPSALTVAVHTFTGGAENQAFRHSIVDLSGDRSSDALVLLSGPNWCGSGGCTLLVFRQVHGKFELTSRSTVAQTPIRVSPEASHGWKTLIVYSKGRGNVLLRFDGSRYPLNPSMQPLATKRQVEASTMALN